MSELYGDDYDSVTGGDRLVSDGLRRLAGAIVFLALVAALGLWAFRLGTRDAAEVPIVRAMEGPSRIQPEDPGGLRAAHQGLEVNAVLAGQPAPKPEASAPLAPPPSALAEEDGPQGELVVAPPPLASESELAAGEDLRMPPQDDGAIAGATTAPADGAPIQTAALVAAAVAERNAAVPDAATAAQTEAPDARPLRRPAGLAPARPAAPATTAAAPAPAAATAPDREVASVQRGARLVQLGAFDSEAITRQAWGILTSRHGDLLGGKSLYVERTTNNARVFYRLRVAGFETADQTRQMCEALRARGVDCIPVTLN